MNAEALVQKYLDIRNYIKSETDAHAERMKPYTKALDTIANALQLLAERTGQSSIKTAVGTAFPVEKTRVGCEDRDTFFDFVFANNARQFLTLHIAKEAVKEYVEQHGGHLPPGVNMERFRVWEVRKA